MTPTDHRYCGMIVRPLEACERGGPKLSTTNQVLAPPSLKKKNQHVLNRISSTVTSYYTHHRGSLPYS